MSESPDLPSFLLARIAEDEQAARDVESAWVDLSWPRQNGKITFGKHLSRWTPARVLAECEAKRAVLAVHRRRDDETYRMWRDHCEGCGYAGDCDDPVVEDINDCPTLLAVALAYREHPDYDSYWSPEAAQRRWFGESATGAQSGSLG